MADHGVLVEKNLRIGGPATMVRAKDIAMRNMEFDSDGENPIPADELCAKRSSFKGPEEMIYQNKLIVERVEAAPGGIC